MYIAALDITLYIFITFSSILVKIKKKRTCSNEMDLF